MGKYTKKELGDYQTPLYFTEIICNYLKNILKISPEIIIEPTCGIGNFLKSASEYFQSKEFYGIDIDKDKLKQVNQEIPNLTLIHEDIFTFKFDDFNKDASFLIIGNPPWITNTELSKINSSNLPLKFNYKNEMAIDAMMGDSNFDISESIILKMIDEFKDTCATIAFLCKTIVSRNIFKEMKRREISYSFVKQLNFNAGKVFKIDADACLFIVQFGGEDLTEGICEVSDIMDPSRILYKFGFVDGKFYANILDVPDVDGECVYEWRQGVKHDCSSVMELKYENKHLINKNMEEVVVESDLLYPLLKSSDLKSAVITQSLKFIIITQRKVKQDTSYIEKDFPMTWDYLNRNREFFDRRKSSIYKNASRFSIFGIGDYSFRKYKVAVSGFYKEPLFCLVYGEKAFMLDDTCYFLSFDDYDEAYIVMLILNSELVKEFLKSIVFLDSKRPYTKNVLKRVDIGKCLDLLTFNDLKDVEKRLMLEDYITVSKLKLFRGLNFFC